MMVVKLIFPQLPSSRWRVAVSPVLAGAGLCLPASGFPPQRRHRLLFSLGDSPKLGSVLEMLRYDKVSKVMGREPGATACLVPGLD